MAAGTHDCRDEILRLRIAYALRRSTGIVFDIDAMLSRPHLWQRRIALWREVGGPDLNELLDRLEQAHGAGSRPHADPAGRPFG